MRAADLSLSIIIIIIFILLYVFNVFVVMFKQIKENWPLYRCNPMVMPFARVFGFDTKKNFTECIQNMQGNYMQYLLQPVNYNIEVMNQVGGELGTSMDSIRGMFDKTRTFIQTITQTLFGALLSMMVEIQRLVISMKDMFGKIIATMATLLYTLSGSISTMNSAWAGPPGKMVRALCFEPNTPLQLKDGTFVAMKDVPLNAELAGGGTRVLAKMSICNVDAAGQHIERMYRLANGATAAPIIVSGSHLVYDPCRLDFVPVEALSADVAQVTDIACPELSCLITSNHVIPIGEWIFHDWEDNNGSVSKSIAH